MGRGLEGKTIVLGVTGSIAAVECVKIIHELRRRGAEVHVVMTSAAQSIVHEWSLEFASGNEVVTEITGEVEHVKYCGRDEDLFDDAEAKADLLLIAPATANTVGKIANGIDDTPVTTFATTAMGSEIPILVAPAMHEPMYDHPGVIENLDKIKEWGIEIIPPRIEEGKAKIATKNDIATECERYLSESPLEGKRVVVTSGRTEEKIDPVRVITTRSSGKMGRAIAEEAYVRGADVTIIHNYDREIRYGESVEIKSAHDMIDASEKAVEEGCDIFVSAAAISDYTVEPRDSKIDSGQDLVLEMKKVPKLVDRIREKLPEAYIVGFKAETGVSKEELVEEARGVMERAKLDLMVANDAEVMGEDETEVELVNDENVESSKGTKDEVADAILDRVERELE